ncbi:putative lipopolysaccharide heptosyltransferase III [Niveibacterium sp. 24ML]|uniref:putative lipopolysaccharide heptosyltransferase III n=1 Tax=Niveibacterium sp. 24ML TaxID=2985512 RepID=UPI0022707780|nr:putative lipopolysaccharide heptosyltransferase III [Niveibacterium sp. 24ML]MCX9154702.1 putative lipopolysaccharide heptosyltransferase III [Niveibacterium sp. 24ML]
MLLTDPIPLQEVRRALVIKLRHHGDVLLTAPVLHALKARAPHCEIDALVYQETAPMLQGHPALTQLHGIDRGWKKRGPLGQAKAELGLLRALRARQYDLVLHMTDHPRGAWIARLTGARWAVGPSRPARGRMWRKAFSHLQGEPLNARRHTAERNLDVLRRIGLYPEPDERVLSIHPGTEAEARADALLGAAGLARGGFIAIHPVSRWMFKSWPAEQVATLCGRLQHAGWKLVFTCGPDADEKAFVARIINALPQPVLDLSGQLSLRELAAVIGRARLFFGVDSAPMHIAAAQQVPTVALFGPSGELEWGPWGVPHRVVASDAHPCRPCGIDGCGGGKISDCLVRLPVEQAWAAVQDLLAETDGRASLRLHHA